MSSLFFPNVCEFLPKEWGIEEINTTDQIEAVRPIWQGMQDNEPFPIVNADIDRYLSILGTSANQPSPYVLLLRKADKPQAMIVGRCEKIGISVDFGYKTLMLPKLYGLNVVYGGVLGRPDQEVSRLLISVLMQILRSKKIDIIAFNHLQTNTIFHYQISKMPSFWLRNRFLTNEPHWRMRIPDSIEDFYALRSKKHRQHLRQYQNKLEKEYSGKLVLKSYTAVEDVDQAIRDASYISRKTYQNSLGGGFQETPHKKAITRTSARKGWFRGHILYIDGEPAAYRFALAYNRIYYGDGIGYDPKWSKYRIGTYLFIKVLEDLCKNGEIDYYDFGFGDAEYKESYGNESWLETAKIYLFAPRLYPILVNLINSLNCVITKSFVHFTQKIELYKWIKRTWRKNLQKKDTFNDKSFCAEERGGLGNSKNVDS